MSAAARPQRIRLSRAKGWRLPPNTVNVARPGPWGNPFVVGRDGTTEECVRLYTLLLGGYICLTSRPTIDAQRKVLRHAIRNVEKLRGKNLACWCRLDKPCHADILLKAAAAPPRKMGRRIKL